MASKQWHGVTGTVQLIDVDGYGVAVDDVLQVVVEDKDLDVSPAADSVQVMVTSTSDGTGLTALTLTETGPATGVFSGTLTLAAATNAAANEFQAANSDTITASYDDALDGEGNDPAPVEASLTALAVGEQEEGGEKVTLCHLPGGNPGNWHTITVAAKRTRRTSATATASGSATRKTPSQPSRSSSWTPSARANPEHRRCEYADGEAAEGALEQEGEEGPGSVDAADGGSTQNQAQLEAFCERKPDHKRCEDLELGGERRRVIRRLSDRGSATGPHA